MDRGRDAVARRAVEGEEDEETEDEREREVGEGITVTGGCLVFGVRGAKTCDRMCNFRCN